MVTICGRYSVLTEAEIIAIREFIKDISMRIHQDDMDSRETCDGQIRPTNMAPVIISNSTNTVSIENLRWGFKAWDSNQVIINARVDTIHVKSMFARLLYHGRCVVPAGQYFEWEKIGRENVKHFIKDRSGNLLFMAGLYRHSPEGNGREFVIITKDADETVKKIHDRMPVLLRADQIEDWFTGKLTPEDITKAEFNMDVAPCDDEFIQLKLEVE